MAGHPPGFINPGLYKVAASRLYAQAFHDITVGDNSVDNGKVKVKGYALATLFIPDLATALLTGLCSRCLSQVRFAVSPRVGHLPAHGRLLLQRKGVQ